MTERKLPITDSYIVTSIYFLNHKALLFLLLELQTSRQGQMYGYFKWVLTLSPLAGLGVDIVGVEAIRFLHLVHEVPDPVHLEHDHGFNNDIMA